MKCPKCGTENAQGEIFCTNPDCGEGLPTTPAPSDQQSQQPAAQATIVKKVATLRVGVQPYDLMEGGKLLIAFKDSDKCKPDIPLDGDKVSSTPIEISAGTDGKIQVTDLGTNNGFAVVTNYPKSSTAEVKIGDILMIGGHLIQIR